MKNNYVALRGPLSRIIESPLETFINEFFGQSLPINLVERKDSFPKYNITRPKDSTDQFTISMALAGFAKEDLKVYTEEGQLYVEGNRPEEKSTDIEYLVKNIAERNFKWNIKLPEFAVVEKTTLVDGILSICIELEIPEEKKPKVYEIA